MRGGNHQEDSVPVGHTCPDRLGCWSGADGPLIICVQVLEGGFGIVFQPSGRGISGGGGSRLCFFLFLLCVRAPKTHTYTNISQNRGLTFYRRFPAAGPLSIKGLQVFLAIFCFLHSHSGSYFLWESYKLPQRCVPLVFSVQHHFRQRLYDLRAGGLGVFLCLYWSFFDFVSI